jgi:hypothetical protein
MKFCGWVLIAIAIWITISVFPDPNLQNYEVIWGLWGLAGYYTIFRANRMRKNGDRYMSQFNQPVVRHVVNYDYNVDVHVHNCNHTYGFHC